MLPRFLLVASLLSATGCSLRAAPVGIATAVTDDLAAGDDAADPSQPDVAEADPSDPSEDACAPQQDSCDRDCDGVDGCAGLDCDDEDAQIGAAQALAMDVDGDGYTTAPLQLCPAIGLVSPSPLADCDDADFDAQVRIDVRVDDDNDGYGFGDAFSACTSQIDTLTDGLVPIATASATDDCDETDPNVHELCGGCFTRALADRAFRVCADPKDRGPANSACGAGMTLASIHSAAEADFVAQTIARITALGVGLTDRVWFGLRETTTTASWSDGSAMDYFGYPNGAQLGTNIQELCGTINDDAWYDDDCAGHSFSSLCATPPT